ncbi:MAG: hypothetical protein ACRD07_15200 [Acidimicrobiales bacterium]
MTPAVDQELLLDVPLGPLWFRPLLSGAPVTPDEARSVVELVLDGPLSRDRPLDEVVRRLDGT